MDAAPAYTVTEDGHTVLRVPAVTCPDCEGSFSPGTLTTGPHKGWYSGRRDVESTSCPVHPVSLRLTSPDEQGTLLLFGAAGVESEAGSLAYLIKVSAANEKAARAFAGDPGRFQLTPGSTAHEVARTAVWAVDGETSMAGRRAWEAAGFPDPWDASLWRLAVGAKKPGLDGDDSGEAAAARAAKAWREAGFEHRQVEGWVRAGFTPRTVPEGTRHARCWATATIAGVPPTDEWGSLYDVANPEFIRAGFDAGQTPDAVRDLAGAIPLSDTGPNRSGFRHAMVGDLRLVWRHGDVQAARMLNVARKVGAGVDWSDAAVCLRAGMTPKQARKHLLSGAEMEPVRLLAALTG